MNTQVHNDIESNNSFTELKGILVKPDETKNEKLVENVVRFVCFLLLFIFAFPMIFCDYYFAINNDVCVKQPLNISLTMYDYLIVNAIFASVLVLGLFMIFMVCDSETFDKTTENVLFIALMHVARCFGISWVIIGAVMYWSEMDKSLCSQQTNNYLTASFILRIIMITIDINNSYNKKRKS